MTHSKFQMIMGLAMDRFEFDCERCNQPIGYDEDIVIETDFSCERICEKCVTDEERKIHSDQWS